MKRDELGDHLVTFGPDFGLWPPECWGIRDRAQAAARNQPLNLRLLPPPPTRTVQGFRLFPGQAAPLTKGERAVLEIRAALKLGARP